MTRLAKPAHHAAIQRITCFQMRLSCQSGLHIGTGRGTGMNGADLPIIRDGGGRPLIPGSSLRGVLRAAIGALAEAIKLKEILPPCLVEKTDKPKDELRFERFWETLDPVARLFGAIGEKKDKNDQNTDRINAYGSRLQLSDLICTSAEASIGLRDGVAIDRETRTAAQGGLYAYEVVDAGTQFMGQVRFLNAEDYEVGLLAQALWMLDQGLLLLGGKKVRGLGWVKVEVTEPTVRTAKEILTGAKTDEDETFGPVAEKLKTYTGQLRVLLKDSGAAET